MASPHVVVFLGSRWAALEHQATRWREVAVRWRARRPDLRLTLVDWPGFSGRALLSRPDLVARGRSWLDGTEVLDVTVPLLPRPTPVDERAWRRVGAAIAETLPAPVDVALSANPLWNPAVPHLGARRTAFDAVDDWRGHPVADRSAARIDEGYRTAVAFDTCTANAARLAQRLDHDFGLRGVHVANGVDLEAFQSPGDPPPGLPGGRFAVYVGVVQERVDVELLCAVAAAGLLPVVVAGPAADADADRLRRAGAVMLGPVPHHQVPAILQRATVGLVPHRVNEFTTSMDPMKLLEYLAAGLPVVTTPLPGVDALSRRVLVADGAAEFVAAVRDAASLERLHHPDAAVVGRGWDAVADRLLAIHVSA